MRSGRRWLEEGRRERSTVVLAWYVYRTLENLRFVLYERYEESRVWYGMKGSDWLCPQD